MTSSNATLFYINSVMTSSRPLNNIHKFIPRVAVWRVEKVFSIDGRRAMQPRSGLIFPSKKNVKYFPSVTGHKAYITTPVCVVQSDVVSVKTAGSNGSHS